MPSEYAFKCCLLEGGGGSNESVPDGDLPIGSCFIKAPNDLGFLMLSVATVSLLIGQLYGHFYILYHNHTGLQS